jgi:SAM-dependent methyltransferase
MSSLATIDREKTGRPGGPVAQPAERRGKSIVFLSSPTEFQMADEWYDFALAEHFWFQWRFRAIRETLGGDRLDEPILEVGCGNGAARGQIEEHLGCRVDGCDVNVAALRRAAPGRGDLYFYDIHQRRREWRGHFGTVLLLDTLEHIRQPERFLESAAYHLKPNGRVLITVPAFQFLYSRYDEACGHTKRYSLPVLRKELHAVGLSVERYTYWGLSLVPVIWARKLVLCFTPSDRAIAVGFQPRSKAVDQFLRALMHVECRLCPRAPIGAALVALARAGGRS